jgi:hypothetical protein
LPRIEEISEGQLFWLQLFWLWLHAQATDVPCGVCYLRQGNTSALRAAKRQAGLLQRLLQQN